MKFSSIFKGKSTEQEYLPLIEAAEKGDMRSIEHHFSGLSAAEKFDKLMAERSKRGSTAILVAAWEGHTAVIEKCFEGLDQTQQAQLATNKITKTGFSPLMAATYKGPLEAAQLLLRVLTPEQQTEEALHQDKTGFTPLLTASFNRNQAIVKLVLDLIPTPKQAEQIAHANKNGVTSVIIAAYKGNTSVIEELFSRLDTSQKRDRATEYAKFGHNALHVAALEGHTEAANLLLENGADPSLRIERKIPIPGLKAATAADLAGNKKHYDLAFALQAAKNKQQGKNIPNKWASRSSASHGEADAGDLTSLSQTMEQQLSPFDNGEESSISNPVRDASTSWVESTAKAAPPRGFTQEEVVNNIATVTKKKASEVTQALTATATADAISQSALTTRDITQTLRSLGSANPMGDAIRVTAAINAARESQLAK